MTLYIPNRVDPVHPMRVCPTGDGENRVEVQIRAVDTPDPATAAYIDLDGVRDLRDYLTRLLDDDDDPARLYDLDDEAEVRRDGRRRALRFDRAQALDEARAVIFGDSLPSIRLDGDDIAEVVRLASWILDVPNPFEAILDEDHVVPVAEPSDAAGTPDEKILGQLVDAIRGALGPAGMSKTSAVLDAIYPVLLAGNGRIYPGESLRKLVRGHLFAAARGAGPIASDTAETAKLVGIVERVLDELLGQD